MIELIEKLLGLITSIVSLAGAIVVLIKSKK